LTPEQRRKVRLDNFASGKYINFMNEDAKKAYQLRAMRLVDAYNIEEPDRVPVNSPLGSIAYNLNNVNMRTVMYDYDQAIAACKAFNQKYSEEVEGFASPMINSGRMMDLLDYKLYSWPGHGLPLDSPGIQFIEAEYMTVEEYDDLITDPSDFWFRTYLPRVFGTLAPFKLFQPATNIIEIISLNQFDPLTTPEIQESLSKLAEVGREYQRMKKIVSSYYMGAEAGFPSIFGNIFAKAPFDTLGDTLRGTTNIMKDMYRRPEKVLAACDKIADFTIRSVLKSPGLEKHIIVQYPLHKGADGWMSQKQFDTFYWPSLKKVMEAFIKEGLIQCMFAEGSFNTRLDSVNEFPKGSVSWMFDQTDIIRAKQMLGSKCSIIGNVPSSLVVTGAASDVKAYCRKLIENCGKGGGYILGAGAIAENPKLENLKAMVAAAREYGVYKK
jgi:uroporphyrinogen-III decarboxylase